MTETWILMVLLASGEIAIEPQASEMLCDTNRVGIVAAAIQAQEDKTCPEAISASCVFGSVTADFIAEGAR